MGEQIVQCDNRILEEGEGTSWWPVGEQIVRRDNRILEGARYVTICCGGLTNQISKRYMMFIQKEIQIMTKDFILRYSL